MMLALLFLSLATFGHLGYVLLKPEKSWPDGQLPAWPACGPWCSSKTSPACLAPTV